MDFEYLGPYKIQSVLGKGGMGTVFKATHSKTGDIVAVKVIAESIANQERFRRRFDSEVETLKRLTNKNIVKLIGYGEEKGRLFYSMEYVEGESLHDKIKREARLTWDVTLKYAIDVCSALKHAHDIGVIHRDLKPSNLLIDLQDSIKMTDFGIAKLYGNAEETALGSILGTADFMPPEQAEGTRVTTRSDLYSLGAVMYACLAGRSPHYAKTTPETLYNVRYKIPDRLSERVRDLPRELEILILELLEKNPEQRPKTALSVWNRLAAMQAGLSKFPSPRPRNRTDTQIAENHVYDAGQSMNLQDVAPSLVNEIQNKSPNEPATHIAKLDSAPPPKKPISSQANEATLVSEELIAASHMGRTTPVATHLADLHTDASQSSPPSTRFTVVENDPSVRRPTTFNAGEESSAKWSNLLSIVLLSGAIIACIAGIYIATRKPTADSLYQIVLATVDNSESLDVIGERLDDFRKSYPDDPRLEEFQDFETEIRMQRRINSLTRRVRSRGETAISPIEFSFVEAMQLRNQNQSAAVQRLRDFLVVFQDRSVLSPEERELVDYAAQELEKLTREESSSLLQSTEFLRVQFDTAKQLKPEQQKAFYQSVIRLYDNKSFGSELVDLAKQRLAELEKSAAE